jgi:hypothetical protein
MKTENSVLDGKLTNEQLGALTRRFNEIIRRINDHTLKQGEVMKLLQEIIIEKKIPDLLGVIKGTHEIEIKLIEHVIDCDADPRGWGVLWVEHQKMGYIKFDVSKVKLFKKIKRRRKPLNANVLSYLMKNQHLIPEEWKKDEKGNNICIFFLGTIFDGGKGHRLASYLTWSGNEWFCSTHSINVRLLKYYAYF